MQPDQTPLRPPPPWRRALPRIVGRVAMLAAVVWGLSLFYGWAHAEIAALETDHRPYAMLGLVVFTIAIYAIAMAIPFVPAVEIALALLLMNGPQVAPFVYLGTLAGLMLAFFVGRRVSLDWLQNAFRDLHMMRAAALILRIKTEDPARRLHNLSNRLPAGLRWLVVDYRYLVIALLVNIPGNSAIGGGGGILMLAGISRLFHPAAVLATLALATAPVPLLVWFLGTDVLG